MKLPWLRWALTAGLLYGVFTETGPWTVLLLSLACVAGETMVFLKDRELNAHRKLDDQLNALLRGRDT